MSKFYVLVGEEESWKCAIEFKVWGFQEKTKGLWNTINKNDCLAFYVTSPISKIIGFGKVADKYIDSSILWPDEKIFGKALWIYRLRLDICFIIKSWTEGIVIPSSIMLNTGRKIITEGLFKNLLLETEKKYNVNISTFFDT